MRNYIACILISLQLPLLGQNHLFDYVAEPSLSIDQEEIIARYEGRKDLLSIEFVEIGSLYNLQDSGEILILSPDRVTDLLFKAKHVEGDTIDYKWYGELDYHRDSNSMAVGYLSFIAKNGLKFGYFTIDSFQYELHDLGSGVQVLLEFSMEQTLCHVLPDEQLFNVNTLKNRMCPELKEIDVLVLWTREGANSITSTNEIAEDEIIGVAETSIFMGNNALRNSDIRNNEVFFNLVGVEEVDFTPTDDIGDDLEKIQEPSDPEAIAIRDLRDFYEADIVIVLVEEAYDGVAGSVLTSGTAGNGDHAYGIVQSVWALQNHILVHEMSHLFGCHHQQCNISPITCQDDTPEIAHGYEFRKTFLFIGTGRYKTIMAVANRTTIPHFSNPDIKFKNKHTGLEGTNDNAQQIRNEACDVSRYRTSSDFIAGIDLHSSDCGISGQRMVEAIVSGGGLSYSYSWQTSINGFQYSSTIGTSSTQQITIPSGVEGLFVKLTVSSGLLSHTAVRFLRPCASIDEEFNRIFPSQSSDESNEMINLSVSPNPNIGSEFIITYSLEKSGNGILELLDSNGKLIRIIKEGYFKAESQSINFNVNPIPQFYMARLVVNNKEKVIKFIKL